MTAILAVVALDGTTTLPADGFAAGIRSLGGFAPFGADEVDGATLRLWVARSFRGTGLAAADGRVLAIDGRLRNRAAFAKQHALAADVSDAALVLSAYAARGEALFESLDADIALLLVDAPRRRVILFRDVLGERGLRYALRGAQLQVSSRGSAIVAMRGETLVPNKVAMAHYFALRAPPDEVAWMQGVEELPAGGLLLFEDGRRRYRRFTPDLPTSPLRFGSDAEAAEAWREVVAGAVARACADATRPVVQLSGGIDSTLIANFVDPARAAAVSWSLASLPQCDESELARGTAAMLGLRQEIVDGDQFPALSGFEAWRVEDEAPIANPYRPVNLACFDRARALGGDVLLPGHFGDMLYTPHADWGPSFLRERGVVAWSGVLAAIARNSGPRESLRQFAWRGWVPWQRAGRPPPWLAPAATDLWTPPPPSRRARRFEKLYGRFEYDDAELGRRFVVAHGLEPRFVFRDPRLLAFVAALPAHYLHSPHGVRWLSRELLRGRVPEPVRTRAKGGNLSAWFRIGLFGSDWPRLRSLLEHPDALWRRYLRHDALDRALAGPEREVSLGILWMALAAEHWRNVHVCGTPGVLASAPLFLHGGCCGFQ
ncbi:MAG: hypothetical protein IPG63_01460 [Xanthomonadales bacterium]|jgi:asparagine synthase (glutamine-hydrolysing)|nr:hypothetical protein [Xanthomonadales bacterium]MBK7146748.1 hypothetical protein [Xanthomonadales bacterium]MCC6560929.1 hypothetical protein [Xanthomonadales bacterium]